MEGPTVFDYFAPSIAAKFDQDDHRVIQSGEPILAQEQSISLAGEQRETWLETNKVPLRDTDGKIVGLVGISSDISARKADEEKLRRFAEQLERSNAELQNFASVASHDLQEPLRKIQAFSDRLKVKCGDALGEQGRDYLARMQNAAAAHAGADPGPAQAFARDQPGAALPAVRSGGDRAAGALRSRDRDRADARARGGGRAADDRCRPAPDAAAFPKPDRQRAQVPEARRSAGGGHLRPRLRRGRAPGAGRDAGRQVCQIRVEDNGIGFEAKFAEQIFVIFQRLHTREEYSGTGIGLAVCRKITDRHGGTIMAKSAQGQGASFIITLPVKQPIAPSSMTSSNHGMPITILMADDDPDDRLLTQEALEEGRLINDIRFVEHGEELLEYLRRQGKYAPPAEAPRPGLILLDLNMPRKDGRAVLKEIKSDPALRTIPVVVLTTSKADEDVYRSYDLGVNSYIVKPVTFEALVDILQTLEKYWFEIVELPPTPAEG